MNMLKNKIDFVLLFSVAQANPNGDPLNGNMPRTDYNDFGEISDVCVKRKIRNRMQDLGAKIFVQSADRADDGYDSLKARADGVLGLPAGKKAKNAVGITNEEFGEKACREWLDVRAFGQVFAYGKGDDGGVSVGIRGPVSIHQGVSVSPVEVKSMQITKSVNGESKDGGKASDTMGMKHMIKFGLYKVKGSINVQLAEKTGFSAEDAELLKKCLLSLFENDTSSARPDGSMEVVKLFWWQHSCKEGDYSSAKVHRAVKVSLKEGVDTPVSAEDYDIIIDDSEIKGFLPEGGLNGLSGR